jgi:hypothetical protein
LPSRTERLKKVLQTFFSEGPDGAMAKGLLTAQMIPKGNPGQAWKPQQASACLFFVFQSLTKASF